MNHHSHLLLTCATLFLFCWSPLSYAQSQEHIDIYEYEFPFHESFQMSLSETRFYYLNLKMAPIDLERASIDLDLTISVTPEQGSDSPKLFVSKNKQFPQTMNDADYSSITTSRNVVFIRSQDLNPTPDYIFLGLICESPTCNANIIVKWDREMKAIAIGEKIIESLNGVSSASMNLTIPNEDEIERIVIHVDAIKASKTDELPSLEVVFMNQEKSLPNNTVSIPRRSSWFEGNTIIIDKDSSLFCTDCLLTLNLKFTESPSLSIQAQTFKRNTLIFGEPILDGVQKGKENSYWFLGRESFSEEDFVFSVKVHQGKVKVSIRENAYRYSKWYRRQYQVENSQDIILSYQERYESFSNYFLILVESEEPSVYSLSATHKKSNQLLISKAPPVRNEIFPQEKITYEILMPLFLVAEGMILNLHSKQPLEVNIMSCRFATDCPGILPADPQHEITNYYGFDDHLPVDKMVEFNSEEIAPGELRIKINPHKSGCYPILIQDQTFPKEPIAVCAYQVTLSNQQLSPVEFTLTDEYKGPNLLIIGEPRFDIVAKKGSLYYVLSVSPYIENIESIQIQLTRFSGDVDIFISKTEKSPNKELHDDIALSYDGLLIIKDRPDLSGIYYIGVHGLEKTSCSFSLSAIIQTKSRLTKDSAFLLNPGKPQKGVLLPKHQYQAQFYKILLNEDQHWDCFLRITVKPLSGRVLIFANEDGELPTAENHQWEGKDHDLKIHLTPGDSERNDLYSVGIFMDMTDPDAHLLVDLTYYITYSRITYLDFENFDYDDYSDKYLPIESPFFLFLSQNTPFFDVIVQNEVRHFEALVPTDQFPITIHKQSAGGNIELYLSTNPMYKYTYQYSYTEKTTKDYITLKACEGNTTLGCSIYITAILTDDCRKTPFSLAISSQESSALALENERQIQSIIPMDNRPATFYYHAIPSKLFVVTVHSPGREAVIYAKRIKIDIESQEKPDIGILNENTAEFTGLNEVSVLPLADSNLTIVALSVYFKGTQEEPNMFKILVSSQITQLSLGVPYKGFVKKDHYEYFMTNITESECALLISLTSHHGKTDLVISYGENTRPTISNHQFSLISKGKINVFQIDNTDLSPGHSMSGSWIIGVHRRISGRFQLTAISQDRKIVDLKPGNLIEMMSLSESSFAYFKYDHAVRQNFQINLTKLSGQLNLYMTSIDSNKDFIPHFPNQTHYKWQILRVASQSVMTIDFNSSHGCPTCTYLIKIEAISSSKFSLEVNHLPTYIPIQSGLEYKGRLAPQEFTIFLLKKSTNFFEENRLDIEMKGNELTVMGSEDPTINLTNYLWKETLIPADPHHFISLPSQNSSRDSFSLLLENPQDKDVNYSFNMITSRLELQTFFGENAERVYDLNPLEKNYFEYNSIDEYGFETDVIFFASQNEEKNIQEIMEKDLKQGKRLKARYWPAEQATTEDGQEVSLEAEAEPKSKSNSSQIIFEQIFSIKNPKGKYMIEIANAWKFPVKFRIFMRKSGVFRYWAFGYFLVNETLQSKSPRFFKFPQKDPGNWYLWLYSCDTTIDLKIENGDLETGVVTIPKGNSYLYKETTPAVDRYVWMNVNPQSQKQIYNKFLLYSYVIDEKEFKNFDLKKENFTVNVTERNRKEVTVEFKVLELQDPESYDEISYKIWLCPDILDLSTMSPLCDEYYYNLKCQSSSLKLSKSQKEPAEISFQNVGFGVYFVKIKATLIYQNRVIKDVEPYAPAYVKIEESRFEKISNEL